MNPEATITGIRLYVCLARIKRRIDKKTIDKVDMRRSVLEPTNGTIGIVIQSISKYFVFCFCSSNAILIDRVIIKNAIMKPRYRGFENAPTTSFVKSH